VALLTGTGCESETPVQARILESAWTLSEQLCEPETVLHDRQTDRLVISNICGFKANGEGYLMLAGLDGNIQSPKWISGLNAPAGMAMRDRTLYVVDIDRVHRIDLDSGEITGAIIMDPPTKALNDIAMADDGTVYVSDSFGGHVYKIDAHGASRFPASDSRFKFANGLHIQGGRLYVGGERFWTVNLESGDIQTDDRPQLADIDGIEGDGQGGLIVSIVGGDVIALPKGAPAEIWTAPGLSSTNHAYLPEERLVIVPTGYDNTVLALKRPE